MKWLLKKLLAPVIREVIEERETEIIKGVKCAKALGQIVIGGESGKACVQEDLDKWNQLTSKIQHYHDITVGLWCIDRDPKDVDIEWIRKNAFQLKSVNNDF